MLKLLFLALVVLAALCDSAILFAQSLENVKVGYTESVAFRPLAANRPGQKLLSRRRIGGVSRPVADQRYDRGIDH